MTRTEVVIGCPVDGTRGIVVNVDNKPWYTAVLAQRDGYIVVLPTPEGSLKLCIEPENAEEIEELRRRVSELELQLPEPQ